MFLVIVLMSVFLLIALSEIIKRNKQLKDYKYYITAGQNKSTLFVTFSLIATIIGASSFIGLINKSYSIGFPAVWWLWAGSIGLFLQYLFLIDKMKNIDAITIPDIISRSNSVIIGKFSALVIFISWIGIIGAQLTAAKFLISILFPEVDTNIILLLVSLFIILYTLIGGQNSVIKTDFFQSILIFTGIILTLLYIMFFKKEFLHSVKIEVLNEKFGILNLKNDSLLYYLIFTGGAYFIGPDMFSRIITAKDASSAKKSVLITSISLIFIAIFIVLLGSFSSYIAKEVNPDNFKTFNGFQILFINIPLILKYILFISALSALISSADTCLMSTASILVNDIIEIRKTFLIKSIIVIVGFLSLIISIFKKDIINILLLSYSFYVPVVVPICFWSIMYSKKNKSNFFLSLFGLVFSLIFAVIHLLTGNRLFSIIALVVSTVFSFLAFYINNRK